MGYEEEESLAFVEEIIDSLGFQGIGGKVSVGLGKFFMMCPEELEDSIVERLEKKKGQFLLLTTALPTEVEMVKVLDNSSYLLERRGGFIQSAFYAEELVKKQEQFFLQAGSVVKERFEGDIYNVGKNGNHPVWRYGKPILMEVSN